MTKQDIIYILILLLAVSIGFLAYNTITAKEKIQTRNNIIEENNIELLANQDRIEKLTEENYNLQQSNESLRSDLIKLASKERDYNSLEEAIRHTNKTYLDKIDELSQELMVYDKN